MEQIGVLGKLLTQLVVLLLAVHFLRQLRITLLDDLLQVAPSVLERLHREPGVRVRSYFEALDLTIQGGQRLEVHLSGGQ
uniref:Putative secreted protein n=1 Tax=Anopheles triannulatus TaxID=58253 RepID=A0A2M4B367_9DIPT